MKKNWPQVPLSEVLAQYEEYIHAPEPQTYSKLSVKLYGKGVVLDAPADGSTLKMKRHQVAKAGQVILSEIWGKKGAIGFVPPEGDGALCTSHFFLFDVHGDKIEPKYLQAIWRPCWTRQPPVSTNPCCKLVSGQWSRSPSAAPCSKPLAAAGGDPSASAAV